MVDNFVYQITHYGKILNANRTYYLTRSQPPFLTAMIRAVHAELPAGDATQAWLRTALAAAIKEYETVWNAPPRRTALGLSRYYGSGIGPCPEVEAGHYDPIFAEYARGRGMAADEFERAYRSGKLSAPELDTFFRHDRAVRESGHDTTYRWAGRCSDFATIDLNALLYRYEIDIARLIREEFDGRLQLPGGTEWTPDEWSTRARNRRDLIRKYLWDAEAGAFADYDIANDRAELYYTPTMLYPLWACHADDPATRLIDATEAAKLVRNVLARLETPGGLAASDEASRGPLNAERVARQWDYPNGWAPHQILAWEGLCKYGFADDAQRLAYRWLYTITRNAADYNGTVPEKYDVVARSHAVFAEYGNVGTEFEYITTEGFGWMNASYQVGLGYLEPRTLEALGALVPPEWIFGAVAPAEPTARTPQR
jgi:alpha,alpha-trehalase